MASEQVDFGNGSDAAPETPKAKPSDKQMNLLAIIMQNVEDQPKINVSSYLLPPCSPSPKPKTIRNATPRSGRKLTTYGNPQWENVATQASLKNDRVAKEMYRQMCKKFGWGKTGGPATATPGSAGDTPTKASRVTKNTGKVGSARKPRGKKAAAAAATAAAAAEDDDKDGQEDGGPMVKQEAANAADPFISGTI